MNWTAGHRAPSRVQDQLQETLSFSWSDTCSESAEHIHSDNLTPLSLHSWSLERDRSAVFTGQFERCDIEEMLGKLREQRSEDELTRLTAQLCEVWGRAQRIDRYLTGLYQQLVEAGDQLPSAYDRSPQQWTAQDSALPHIASQYLRLSGRSHWTEAIGDRQLRQAELVQRVVDAALRLSETGEEESEAITITASRVSYGCSSYGTFEIDGTGNDVTYLQLREAAAAWLRCLESNFLESLEEEYEYQTDLRRVMLEGCYAVVDEDGAEVDRPSEARLARRWDRKARQQAAWIEAETRRKAKTQARAEATPAVSDTLAAPALAEPALAGPGLAAPGLAPDQTAPHLWRPAPQSPAPQSPAPTGVL